MDLKDKIAKAKAEFTRIFAKYEEELAEPGTLIEGTLADGTVIKYDKLEEGGKVSVVTEQGEVNAPEGDHELQDGSIISIDAAGLITAIKPKEVEEPVEEEVKTPEQMKAVIEKFATGAPEERITNLETLSKALMNYCFGWEMKQVEQKQIVDDAIATYKTKFAAQFKDQAEVQRSIIELMEVITEEGSADPIQKPKAPITEKGDKKSTARSAFINAVKNLNTEDK